jgi:dTDP-4-dehydrorhamnose 3,5-epimerase
MEIERLAIPDVLLLRPRVFTDERGRFFESWSRDRYREAGILEDFVQDNISISKKGVLRGLHAQRPPHAQGKLVSVLQGRVFDVAVDTRPGSTTYGQWVGVELTAAEANQMYIPPGFLHGFVALEDTIFSYKCSVNYTQSAEFSVLWSDPQIGVTWPILDPILSEKDRNAPVLKHSLLEHRR